MRNSTGLHHQKSEDDLPQSECQSSPTKSETVLAEAPCLSKAFLYVYRIHHTVGIPTLVFISPVVLLNQIVLRIDCPLREVNFADDGGQANYDYKSGDSKRKVKYFSTAKFKPCDHV
jgi:hypothetical protein